MTTYYTSLSQKACDISQSHAVYRHRNCNHDNISGPKGPQGTRINGGNKVQFVETYTVLGAPIWRSFLQTGSSNSINCINKFYKLDVLNTRSWELDRLRYKGVKFKNWKVRHIPCMHTRPHPSRRPASTTIASRSLFPLGLCSCSTSFSEMGT